MRGMRVCIATTKGTINILVIFITLCVVGDTTAVLYCFLSYFAGGDKEMAYNYEDVHTFFQVHQKLCSTYVPFSPRSHAILAPASRNQSGCRSETSEIEKPIFTA